jgi:hypothetical protein
MGRPGPSLATSQFVLTTVGTATSTPRHAPVETIAPSMAPSWSAAEDPLSDRWRGTMSAQAVGARPLTPAWG